MRRYSVLLSSAAILLAIFVTYTYIRAARRDRRQPPRPVARMAPGVQAVATAWHWSKDDPQTNCPVVRAEAKSFRAIHDPSTFELTGLRLRLFKKGCSAYTYVESGRAEFDELSGVMNSRDAVLIIMNVPADKEPSDNAATARLVHIRTGGVRYETKSGKVETTQPAQFHFANGSGHSVGADYDPNTRQLHMKAQASLDWLGNGPPENAMHIEAGQLRYEEDKGKVYLWPWSRLKRSTTVINAAASEVTLDQGVLRQVDALRASGTNTEENRTVEYGAGKLVALTNDNGDITQITAEPNAHLTATSKGTRTAMTSAKAVLRFEIATDTVNGQERNSSILQEAIATGHAVVASTPVPKAGSQLADTRILRSEEIDMMMRTGGKEIESLHTNAPGELEFKPNQPERPHRWMNGDRIQIAYGEDNAIDSFHATKVTTRTQKPPLPGKLDKDGKPLIPPVALTSSDELDARFVAGRNDLSTLEQKGHFQYEEGQRHATAVKAFLEQTANKITLTEQARVWDDTGTTAADQIVLNQQNGDMDAAGQVASMRAPDAQKTAGKSSLLDERKPLQARADQMTTRENNLKVRYSGHALLWQGANRLHADVVDIDRDAETLHAAGNVVSQLVDHQPKDEGGAEPTASAPGGAPLVRVSLPGERPPSGAAKKNTGPIYTLVHAPDMFYRDDERLAHYTGGVRLVRDKMTVTSDELRAYLTRDDEENPSGKEGSKQDPEKKNDDGGTSLDHALADGNVKVVQTGSGRTRTGTSEHCEYYPKQNKVVLEGGLPRMSDTRKGITAGERLTYFSDSDHMIVEGQPKKPVVSDLNKQK